MESNLNWGKSPFRPTWGRPAAPPNPTVNAFRPFKTKPSQAERMETLKAEMEARLKQSGFAGFQVMRREFVADRFDPSMIISKDSVSFNNACIGRLENAMYVQFMIDADTRQMLIRPCRPGARGAIRWCTSKRKRRRLSCVELTDRLYTLMKWDREYNYQIRGIETEYRGERLYFFDLPSRQAFVPTYKDPVTGKRIHSKPLLPEEWKDSFGMSVEETEASMKIVMDEDDNQERSDTTEEGTVNE